MSSDISTFRCTLPWTLVRGESKHVPAHWLDRTPLARDEAADFRARIAASARRLWRHAMLYWPT